MIIITFKADICHTRPLEIMTIFGNRSRFTVLLKKFDFDDVTMIKVLDFLPYPFLLSESKHGIQQNIFVNSRFLEEIGYTCEEIPSINDWFERAYPDEQYRNSINSEWSNRVAIAKLNGEDCVVTKARIQTKHHGQKWYEVKASIYGPINFVAFVNIDEKIKREEDLGQLNENKDRTLSILSHDLRTPLMNLYSILQLLSDGNLSEEDSRQIIRKLNDEVFRMLEFLETTLQWSKINFQSINIEKKPVNDRAIIRTLVALYASPCTEKSINLSIKITDSTLITDADIFAIVFRNVLSNAIKYTPAFGRIVISNILDDDKYCLVVENTGNPISFEQIEKILAKNYTSQPGTQGERGLGLGLKLCQQVLALVGGKLEIVAGTDSTAFKIIFDR